MANMSANRVSPVIRPTTPRITTMQVLQIGDVHYDHAVEETIGDFQDKAFPAVVRNVVSLNPIRCVLRKVASESKHQKFDGILLCGDLASRGDPKEYLRCVEALRDALNLRNYETKRLHAVPGNHDIDRAMAGGSDVDSLSNKFSPFSQAWEQIGIPILTVDTPRSTNISKARTKLQLTSINSAVGCGEKRFLPSGIRDELDGLLKSYSQTHGGLAGAFDLVGESLDTPAFRQEDVQQICDSIHSLDSKVLPIVLSHHNLLPQALLRTEMYTELINSGFVRSRLLKLNRPIIYCHGHIHSNPVELIEQSGIDNALIVCIAAPELRKGFNILRIYFSSKHYPLGCEVKQFEIDQRDGGMVEIIRRVPFQITATKPIRTIAHDLLPEILSQLSDRETRFSELLRSLKLDSGAIATSLQEAHWLGLIEVTNPGDEVTTWNFRRLPR